MLAHLRPAAVMLALFVALLGVVYPLAITVVAEAAMPRQAGGSLIRKDGAVIGSALIGQAFASDRYFHGRPSATSAPDPGDSSKTVDAPYNAASSSGSNLGPTSRKLIDRVAGDVKAMKEAGDVSVPADSVTTSGSGLDPHISPENAANQIVRVAKARNTPVARIRELVASQTEGRLLGIIGEPRVNVLALNLALDAMKP
ncbi:MAG: potassium-transporting ATPase subunit KdpC [Pseudomonadota bacterium]